MWLGYFLLGFVLAVYVFYAFLGRLGTLFEHDALERGTARAAAESSHAGGETAP
jgi:hypothetical protein